MLGAHHDVTSRFFYVGCTATVFEKLLSKKKKAVHTRRYLFVLGREW